MIKAPELDITSLTVVQNWDVEVKAAIAKASPKVRFCDLKRTCDQSPSEACR